MAMTAGGFRQVGLLDSADPGSSPIPTPSRTRLSRRLRAGAVASGAAVLALGASGTAIAAAEAPTLEQVLAPQPSDASPAASITVGPRIGGGRPATPGEHPFIVHVGIDAPPGDFACTGSVISPQWILTAAHCITQADGSFFPSPVFVTVTAGATDISTATPANRFAADLAVRPKDWLGWDNGFAHDWALLHLTKPVNVRGLPLPPGPHPGEVPGVVATLAGYGKLSEIPDVNTTTLHVGTAPILSDADCSFYFRAAYVPGLMSCTGPPPGSPPIDATTCKGDSGGPLFVRFGSDHLQAGITSFGPVPCQTLRTGGYTKVSSYSAVIGAELASRDPSLAAPAATTGGVVQQLTEGLEVQGTIDPNGIATAYELEWGTTPALGDEARTGLAGGQVGIEGGAYAGTGSSPVSVTARISGAPADTQIFYRFSALNVAGRSNGAVASGQTAGQAVPPPATPPPPPPVAQQQPAAIVPAPTPPRCMGQPATIVGTPGRDVIVGTPRRDVIVALAGHDVIRSRDGDDLVCAGPGRDSVSGGPGGDKLLGQSGNDSLRGQAGDDTMVGGSGRDNIHGGAGKDRGGGGGGRDILTGGPQADRLFGGSGPDILRGNGGPDLLVGNGGRDIGIGGPGRDRFRSVEVRRA
jgi:hypothetical protein